MSEFSKVLEGATQEVDAGPHIDQLADLVESQISNVIGGGYSRYGIFHEKGGSSN
jgi:hypothetical protein